jgi:hypothetical protein
MRARRREVKGEKNEKVKKGGHHDSARSNDGKD